MLDRQNGKFFFPPPPLNAKPRCRITCYGVLIAQADWTLRRHRRSSG